MKILLLDRTLNENTEPVAISLLWGPVQIKQVQKVGSSYLKYAYSTDFAVFYKSKMWFWCLRLEIVWVWLIGERGPEELCVVADRVRYRGKIREEDIGER